MADFVLTQQYDSSSEPENDTEIHQHDAEEKKSDVNMLAMTSVLASFSLFPLFLSYRHVLAMTQVITFVCVHFFLSHDA